MRCCPFLRRRRNRHASPAFVTTAQAKNDSIRIALDLTKEWDALQAGVETPSALITGVVVVRADFAAENPEAVSAFLDSYKESVDFVNGSTEDAAALLKNMTSFPPQLP